MLKIISLFIFRIKGWKIKGQIPPDIKKCVIIQAPHTSFYDFFIGWLASNIIRKKFRFMIKKEAFFFPLAGLLKACGGVPVDRNQPKGTTKMLVDYFKKNEKMYLVITPEGTREYTNNWKKGFYSIALAANVPVLLGYIDYKDKICGLSENILYPSGDYDKDFEIITNFYTGRQAKYPEHFNLSTDIQFQENNKKE
ncbi:MAG: 1-acyl-sn-glycerol-3-phosphate acyltransferase [Bacteroidales bacterium]|nr:1-acyl-sn-glycerol-3-phosphate acyltransferase [Bacteroidales bacterium]